MNAPFFKIMVTWLVGVQLAMASNYYVSTTGDDAYDGTAASYVGGVEGPKATIQACLDVADHGDVVTVADGAYTGPGNCDLDYQGKLLVLESENGPQACIIDCQADEVSSHRGFIFQNAETTEALLDGFTITNGYAWGGAIYCIESSPTIRNCVMYANSAAGKGGALACDNAEPSIIDCTFSENVASDGGAVYAYRSGPAFAHCVFTQNETSGAYPNGRGAALCLEESVDVTLEACAVYGNVAVSLGGALFAADSTVLITNCVITGNLAQSHGGGLYLTSSGADLIHCTFHGNFAQWHGGALRCYDGAVVNVTNCILWGDSVDYVAAGREIDLSEQSVLTLFSTDLEGGRDAVFGEIDCTLNFETGNIYMDPCFVSAGYWDPGQAVPETVDAVWVQGDYRLGNVSPAIDRGDTAATEAAQLGSDLAGEDRVQNDSVDMGAYEMSVSQSALTITRFIARAGRRRADHTDRFIIIGEFDAGAEDFAGAEQLYLRVGPYDETINLDDEKLRLHPRRPLYTYRRRLARGEDGAIGMMQLNLDRGSFILNASNLDLTGLAAPVQVVIVVGDYRGGAVVSDDVINNGRAAPLQFLVGYAYSLTLDRHRFRVNERYANADQLLLMGTVTVKDSLYAINQQRINIAWGDFDTYIPAGSLTQIGQLQRYVYRKDPQATTPVQFAQFDFERCQYRILIRNAAIGPQTAPLTFGLSLLSVDQSVTVLEP